MAFTAKEKTKAVVATFLFTGVLGFKFSVGDQPEHFFLQNWYAIVIVAFFLVSLILRGDARLLLVAICSSFVLYAVILLAKEVSPFILFILFLDGYVFLLAGFPTFFIVAFIGKWLFPPNLNQTR